MTERNTRLSGEAKLPEDLSVLERRNALGEADRRRLKMALAASDALACTHGLGRDFDALDTQCAGDAELMARVVASAKARYSRPVPVPVRVRSRLKAALPWLASLSLLLVAMAAGATLWPLTKRLLTGQLESSRAPASSAEGSAPLARSSRLNRANALASQASRRSLGSEKAPLSLADAPTEGSMASGDHAGSVPTDDGVKPGTAPSPLGNEGAGSGDRVVTAWQADASEHVPSSVTAVTTTVQPNQTGRAALADDLRRDSMGATLGGDLRRDSMGASLSGDLRRESMGASLSSDLQRDSMGATNVSQPSNVVNDERPERARSAAELFSEANLARRQGNAQRARTLYATLRQAYPAASETALSCVMVGRMDLQVGAAPDALRQFERYLRLAPAGPLVEEALAGKAAAYRELSRPGDERATWQALLGRYPDSVYAAAARKRLEELR